MYICVRRRKYPDMKMARKGTFACASAFKNEGRASRNAFDTTPTWKSRATPTLVPPRAGHITEIVDGHVCEEITGLE